MRWISIVGARPQFVKVAALSRAIGTWERDGEEAITHQVLHTGQHYDPALSDGFWQLLGMPPPVRNLGVGKGSPGAQTGRMLEGIDAYLRDDPPDAILIYGDTNSAAAGALAAAKIPLPLVHVEAGMRSFDRRMPEEVNRVLADHLSDLLLAPTANALLNLEREGLGARARLVGDLMLDALQAALPRALDTSSLLARLEMRSGAYAVATIHRAGNTDAAVLAPLLEALNMIATWNLPVVFPVHPRTRSVLSSELPTWRPAAHLHLIDPLGYEDMLCLTANSRMVLTDSGGLQREAFFLGRPCITLRAETEWIETLEADNVIAADPTSIHAAVTAVLARAEPPAPGIVRARMAAFGGGAAAAAIVRTVRDFLGVR